MDKDDCPVVSVPNAGSADVGDGASGGSGGSPSTIKPATSALLTRRDFALGAVGAVAVFGLAGSGLLPEQSLVRPPGGQDEKKLRRACLHCDKCRQVCPQNAILPAHIEQGLLNSRTPQMGFRQGWCNFCAEEPSGPKCLLACPTQALSDECAAKEHLLTERSASLCENAPARHWGLAPESKTAGQEIVAERPQGQAVVFTQAAVPNSAKTTIPYVLGKAEIRTEWCLAFRGLGCHECVDVCPYQAMRLTDDAMPEVIEDVCNGCGRCEYACISLSAGSLQGATDRAITVHPPKA